MVTSRGMHSRPHIWAFCGLTLRRDSVCSFAFCAAYVEPFGFGPGSPLIILMQNGKSIRKVHKATGTN